MFVSLGLCKCWWFTFFQQASKTKHSLKSATLHLTTLYSEYAQSYNGGWEEWIRLEINKLLIPSVLSGLWHTLSLSLSLNKMKTLKCCWYFFYMHSVICSLTAQHDQTASKFKFTSMGTQHAPWWQVYLKVQSTQPHYKNNVILSITFTYHFRLTIKITSRAVNVKFFHTKQKIPERGQYSQLYEKHKNSSLAWAEPRIITAIFIKLSCVFKNWTRQLIQCEVTLQTRGISPNCHTWAAEMCTKPQYSSS